MKRLLAASANPLCGTYDCPRKEKSSFEIYLDLLTLPLSTLLDVRRLDRTQVYGVTSSLARDACKQCIITIAATTQRLNFSADRRQRPTSLSIVLHVQLILTFELIGFHVKSTGNFGAVLKFLGTDIRGCNPFNILTPVAIVSPYRYSVAICYRLVIMDVQKFMWAITQIDPGKLQRVLGCHLRRWRLATDFYCGILSACS